MSEIWVWAIAACLFVIGVTLIADAIRTAIHASRTMKAVERDMERIACEQAAWKRERGIV